MLKLKRDPAKLNFLNLSTRVENLTIQWLIAFFIFASISILLSSYLPDFVRQYSFQFFLLIAMIFIFLAGWKPLLNPNWKSVFIICVMIGSYFLFLLGVDSLLKWYGVGGESVPFVLRSDLWLLAVLAPVVEEAFFRDLVFRSLYQRWNRLDVAIIFSSLLFMTAHLSLYPGALLLGLISSLLVIFSKSLWPSFVFHSISNLSLLFLPVWFPHILNFLRSFDLLEQFYR